MTRRRRSRPRPRSRRPATRRPSRTTRSSTVDGIDTFSGTVTFHLCGPIAADATTTLCATGGVQIGSPSRDSDTVDRRRPMPRRSTSAGRYCWRADFSGDAMPACPARATASASECFVVNAAPADAHHAGRRPAGRLRPADHRHGHPVGHGAQAGHRRAGRTSAARSTRPAGGDANGTITFVGLRARQLHHRRLARPTVTVSGDGSPRRTTRPVRVHPEPPRRSTPSSPRTPATCPNTLGVTAAPCAGHPTQREGHRPADPDHHLDRAARVSRTTRRRSRRRSRRTTCRQAGPSSSDCSTR